MPHHSRAAARGILACAGACSPIPLSRYDPRLVFAPRAASSADSDTDERLPRLGPRHRAASYCTGACVLVVRELRRDGSCHDLGGVGKQVHDARACGIPHGSWEGWESKCRQGMLHACYACSGAKAPTSRQWTMWCRVAPHTHADTRNLTRRSVRLARRKGSKHSRTHIH